MYQESVVESQKSPNARRRRTRASDWRISLRLPLWGTAACALALALFLSATRFGPLLTPDSIQYLNAAEHVLAGDGVISTITPLTSDAPMTVLSDWPPLYPALIAWVARSGVDIFTAARILNLVALLALLVGGGLLARRLGGPGAGGAAMMVLAFAFPVAMTAAFAWSETVATALVLFMFLALDRGLADIRWSRWSFLAAGILAGGAMMTRYLGLAAILAGGWGLWFLNLHRPRGSRVRGMLWFAVPAVVPNALWLYRNHVLTGATFGPRSGGGGASLDRVAMDLVQTLFRDLVSPVAGMVEPWTFGLTLCGATGVLLVALTVIGGLPTLRFPRLAERSGLALALGAYVLVYGAMLAAGQCLDRLDPINTRFLAPVYPVLIVLAVAAVRAVLRSDRRWAASRRHGVLLAAGLGLLALPQVVAVDAFTWKVAGAEDRSLTDPYWISPSSHTDRRSDPGMERLEALAGEGGLVLTNLWESVGLCTDAAVKPLPDRGTRDWRDRVGRFEGALVAVHRRSRPGRIGVADLDAWAGRGGNLETLTPFGNWSFFRVTARGETQP